MKRIGESLSTHHDQLDRLLALTAAAARAGEWAGYRARLSALREALLEHMSYEEEELFPALVRGGLGAGEIEPLQEQHLKLRIILDTLNAAAPQYDPEGCMAELESLTALQKAHHASELAACYPESDRMAAPPAAPPPLAAGGASAPLDLRGLQPPEPIVRIFEALERSPRKPLRAILPHEPVPLYGLLRERGFAYTGTPRADGGFEVLIEPA
ncbi:MAG TPA: hemerythrin domain-containing protein [Burkholderiales bacterium]